MMQPQRQDQKIWIPRISDKRLRELFEKIKPVVRMARMLTTWEEHNDGSFTVTTQCDPQGKWRTWKYGQPYYIEETELQTSPYLQRAVPDRRAHNLILERVIITYHAYEGCGSFKASIAEVLTQIPESLVDSVTAFEIMAYDDVSLEELREDHEAFEAGYHSVTTRLYA